MKCINMMAELRGDTSPPSRGAWIEMLIVAGLMISAGVSPPSRGAWIEIMRHRCPVRGGHVAPLAGGVD